MAIRLRTVAVRAWLLALKSLLGLLVVLILVLGFLIGTEGGRLLLVAQAQNWVPRLTGQHLAIEGALSPSLENWRFSRIEWEQSETGAALVLEDVALDFRPLYLLSTRLWIDAFTVRHAQLRLPELQAEAAPEIPPEAGEPLTLEALLGLWQQIPASRIDELSIGRLTLSQAELPDLDTSVDAVVEVNWGSWPIRLDLALGHETLSHLDVKLAVDAAEALRLSGSLETPGDSAWAQWMLWPLDEPVLGDWDLWLRTDGNQINVDAEQLVLPWRTNTLSGSGRLGWRLDDSRLSFDNWLLTVDQYPTRLHGYVQPDSADLSIQSERIPLSLADAWLDLPELTGDLAVSGRLTGGWLQPAFNGEASFAGAFMSDELNAALTTSATAGGLDIEQLRLQWGSAVATVQGPLSWQNQQLDLQVQWQDITQDRWHYWVEAWPEDLTLSLSGQGRLTGALPDPDLTANLDARGAFRQQPVHLQLGLEGNQHQVDVSALDLITELGQISARAQANLQAQTFTTDIELTEIASTWLDVLDIDVPVQQDWQLNGRIRGQGDFTDPIFAGDLQIDGHWQQQALGLNLGIERLTLRAVNLNQLQLALADARLQASGDIDWEQETLNLTGQLDDLRVRMLRPLLDDIPDWLDDLTGGINANFRLSGPWLEPRVSTDVNFAGRWLEQPLTANLAIESEAPDRFRVQRARVEWSALQLGYAGTVWPFEPRLDGQFEMVRLTMADVARLPFDLPQELDDFEGEMNVSGQVQGDALNPDVRAEMAFRGQWQAQPLAVNVDIDSLTAEGVSIREARLSSGDAMLAMNGSLGWQPLSMNLNTRFEQWQIEQWLSLLPNQDDLPLESLSGTLEGDLNLQGAVPALSLEGRLNGRGRYLEEAWALSWAGQGRLDAELKHDLNLDWGESSLTLDLANIGDQLDGTVRLTGFTLQQLAALGVDLGPEYQGGIDLTAVVEGGISDPYLELQATGQGVWQSGTTLLNGGTPWQLDLNLAGRLQDWQIQSASASLGPAGELTLSGRGSMDTLELNANLMIPQLSYWLPDQPEWHGALEAELGVSGSLEAPDVNASLNWQASTWPLQLVVDLVTEQGEHRLQTRLTDAGQQRLRLDLNTPQTGLDAWQDDLGERPFAAELYLDLDSTVLAPLLREVPDQDFSGDILGRLSISGTMDQPRWEGQAELRNGRYENAALGTILSGMSATLTANNQNLDLNLNANDGGAGRVSLAGGVLWLEDREQWWMPEMDLRMDLRNARLLRRVDIEATTNGQLTVIGPWQNMTVAGIIDVIPLTIRLDNVLQATGSGLNVVRLDAENGNGNGEAFALEDNPYLPGGQWEVRLRAERRAQIYGQGLVAELSGELDITDDLLQPEIGGRFEIIRGTYTAFGRIFVLDRGTIQIQGNQILLDVYGLYEGPDLRVELNVSGNQDRLNLTLTSTPPLANDELLARLLFGRSVQEMSAFEAIILANELNKLRNPGAGGDILGETRDRLGLDTLLIDTESNEEGDTGINIAAGRYLSDRVYLEVETGVGTDQGFSSSLQYQITPNLSVELYTRGQFNSGGLELNWKNDY